ncbi:PD-(D/E)XK nuclease family protein [Rhizobium sp. PL01]|uniref:PDDEXK-like family protein n=1 Tax=Rhizobium sp. PL01 TaxID=3085631 RepID=UPI002980A730|nr:PD-(D/E)XK nuclease family protein [Rhizobium sp. PL01]MDW5318141.1 PD-(D/E)XK nuclease family protein [Rhizobium sp. PL01]
MDDIPLRISELIMEDADFQNLEKSLDIFCPFEAVGMVSAEIRHSNFLSYILNPNRPHGFKGALLRTFLMSAMRIGHEKGLSAGLTPLDIHLMDMEVVEVRREWRNIDLLLIAPTSKLVVAVELKIDASQSKGQLTGYRRVVHEQWPDIAWRKIFIFLTKHDEMPDDLQWLPMPLSLVIEAFKGYISQPELNQATLPHQMLSAYCAMAERHHMENRDLVQLANAIWSRHEQALTFLISHQPDIWGPIHRALLDRVHEIPETANRQSPLTLQRDHDTSRITRFAIVEWDTIPGMLTAHEWTPTNRLLLYELKFESNGVSGYLYMGRGGGKERDSILNALGAIRKSKKLTAGWTRLESRLLLSAADASNADPDEAVEQIISGFKAYILESASRTNALLSTLQPVDHLHAPAS